MNELLSAEQLEVDEVLKAKQTLVDYLAHKRRDLLTNTESDTDINYWCNLKLAVFDLALTSNPDDRFDWDELIKLEDQITNAIVGLRATEYYSFIEENRACADRIGFERELKTALAIDVIRRFVDRDFVERVENEMQLNLGSGKSKLSNRRLNTKIQNEFKTRTTWLTVSGDYAGIPTLVEEMITADIETNHPQIADFRSFLVYAASRITKDLAFAIDSFAIQSIRSEKISLETIARYVSGNMLGIRDLRGFRLLNKINPLA